LLGGRADIRLTDASKLSVEYWVSQVARTTPKARKTCNVCLPGHQRPVGTIDERQEFVINDKMARHPETTLFARWYEDIRQYHPCRIGAQDLGKCGRCGKRLSGPISRACP
jgi:hypothetical protein